MHDIVDTITMPLLNWLSDIYNRLSSLSVPLARPLNLSNYFGYFAILGPVWQTCITTAIALAVLYLLVYVISNNMSLIQRFINFIKLW